MTRLICEADELRRVVADARRAGRTVGLVPTMGALHEGHLSLVRAARRETDLVIVTIFVNPTQFGPGEDYEEYSRDLDADVPAAESAGADVVFAPSGEFMYPEGYVTHVIQHGLTEVLCGASRPSHFRGVCTVVAKLFNLTQPDIAYFGRKDFQQSVVIRRMVKDLNFPVEIRVRPIVREPDGLAMSSRNQYLSESERRQAPCLHRALERARELIESGERRSSVLLDAMRAEIGKSPDARADYIEVVAPETLRAVETIAGGAVAVLAVRFPGARLIDNAILTVSESEGL